MNNSLRDLVVMGLAVWRMSSLLTSEKGPLHIFVHIRELARIKHSDTGKVSVIPETFWGELLSCVWCISPYIALVATVLYLLFGSVIVWCCLPLALSAFAILVHRYAR